METVMSLLNKIKPAPPITPDQEEQYYEQAIDWDEEIYRKETAAKKRWRLVAMGFAVIALTAVVGMAGMAPLKTVVPYVIKVEKTTGIVEVLNPLEQRTVKQEEAITKYFIVKYLNAREQYDPQRREQDYIIVGKLSSERCFAKYRQWFDDENPESPLNLYGEDATVTYHVRDVSMLDDDTAIIHIKRNVNRLNELRESYWAITLSFQWLLEPKAESDRFINPLGFQVTRYRQDQEIMEDIEVRK